MSSVNGGGSETVPAAHGLRAQLVAEVDAMLRHVFANGLTLPPSLVDATAALRDDTRLSALMLLHGELAALVAPARPGTLCLLQADSSGGGLIAMLGPLVNLRRLTVAAFVCTLVFVVISVSPLVDASLMAGDVYSLSGMQQLLAMGFLLSAAGMGSTFQALFTAQTYVSAGTYDPVYDGSYWVRIGLGFVSGLMLSVLVPLDMNATAPTVQKPMLALLGGFSASLVHRILQRLVDMVESLFEGGRPAAPPSTGVSTQVSAGSSAPGDAPHDITRTRIHLATQLCAMRSALAQGRPTDEVHALLSNMLSTLLDHPADATAAAGACGPSSATGVAAGRPHHKPGN